MRSFPIYGISAMAVGGPGCESGVLLAVRRFLESEEEGRLLMGGFGWRY